MAHKPIPTEDMTLSLIGIRALERMRELESYSGYLFLERIKKTKLIYRASFEGAMYGIAFYVKSDNPEFPWQMVMHREDGDVEYLFWKSLDDPHTTRPDNWEGAWGEYEKDQFNLEILDPIEEELPEEFEQALSNFLCVIYESWNTLHEIQQEFQTKIRDWGEALQLEMDTLVPHLPNYKKEPFMEYQIISEEARHKPNSNLDIIDHGK